jgi:DNA-binding beta-propeller fold protein YncE
MSNNKDFKVKNGIKPTVYHEAVGTVVSESAGYNLAGASYDSVSFSVAGQEGVPRGVFFKPDGTKMYITGSGGDDVNEYDLSTAWDITTASFLQDFSVVSQDTAPEDLFFKPDGTKMYVVGSTADAVHEYTLSTAWDVSSSSYVQSFSVATQSTLPNGLFFKPDGTKMYVVGADVYEYDLSTAWDVSTASHLQTATTPTYESIFFTSDGTVMYLLSASNVVEYNLSTEWDVSTAATSGVFFSISTEEPLPGGFFFKTDGTKMYVVGAYTDTVHQYSTVVYTKTLDLSTGSVFEITPTTDITVSLSNPADSGTVSGATLLLGSAAKTTYDFVNGSLETTINIASQSINPNGLHFKPDGTKMYVLTAAEALNEYNLSTAWDIGSAVWYQGAVVNQEIGMEDVFLSPDGTKLYAVGATSDAVYEYTLSTAWDISTISYVQSFSVTSQDTAPVSVFFKTDGTKMYVVGQSGDAVSEYDLITAWDISTASYSQNFSVASEDGSPEALFFTSDGTKMFVLGSIADEVNSYNLSTAWDVSTASYNNTFSVATEETSPGGLFFSSDGARMYVCGQTGDSVYQYNVATYNVVTYDTTIKWDVGVAPEGFDASGTTDIVTFRTRDGGTTYNAALAIAGAQ